MLRSITKRSLAFGIVAGLVVTLFDGLYMVLPHIPSPINYPCALIIFNVLFWAAFGLITGFLMWCSVHHRADFPDNENHYWVLFFLAPFALMYGLLGKCECRNGVRQL